MPKTPRRFTIADGLALIAATAVGLAPMRPAWTKFVTPPEAGFGTVVEAGAAEYLAFSVSLLTSLAVTWSIALTALSMRRPRLGRRQLMRSPGYLATLAGSLGAAITGLILGVRIVLGVSGLFGLPPQPIDLGLHAAASIYPVPAIGFGVAFSWLTLAVGGRWRPESGSIDRLGRALGIYWISAGSLTSWLVLNDML